MRAILVVAGALIALPGALAAVHLTLLTVASLFYRAPRSGGSPPPLRFLVLIPARNEEAIIGATLASINAVRRRDDVVVVVADRCSDRTAEIARAAGALVVERPRDASPGRAASLRDGLEWSGRLAWDVVVFVDADSVIAEGFFEACEAVFASGAGVAQARAEAERGEGLLAHAGLAATALAGVALPRGRDRIGGWVRLKGSGMLLRRQIAERHRFQASGASEDGQYSLDLCLAGVVHRHVDDARLSFATSRDISTTSGQKLRYETGRLYTARRYVRRLLARPSRQSLDAAVFLCTPPVAVAMFLLTMGAFFAAMGGSQVVAGACLALLLCIAADVMIGMVEARVPAKTWLALALAPAYIPYKAWIQLRALARIGSAEQPYEPTVRD